MTTIKTTLAVLTSLGMLAVGATTGIYLEDKTELTEKQVSTICEQRIEQCNICVLGDTMTLTEQGQIKVKVDEEIKTITNDILRTIK